MSELTWRHTGAWQGGAVHSLAFSFDKTNPIALAATDAGVFRSADGGCSWARVRGLAYAAAHGVAYAPNDAGMAFAATHEGGLFRSQDAGESWQPVSSWSFGVINALALSPNFGADGALFAATPAGVYRSLNGGRGWQSASFGLLDADVLCLACAPDFASSEVMWAGSAAGGLYRSRNAGRAWRESGEGLADSAVLCLAYLSSMLFAGTEGAGVFSLIDEQWRACGLTNRVVNCLVVRESVVWAGTDAGVFQSNDEGRTWACVLGDEGVLALAVAVDGSATSAAIAGGLAGVWRSADGGCDWQRATEGMTAHVPPLAIRALNGELFLFDVAGGVAHASKYEMDEARASSRGDKPGFFKKPGLSPRVTDSVIVCAASGGTAQAPLVLAATEREVLRWQADAFQMLAHQPALKAGDAICALTVMTDRIVLLGTRAGSVAISLDGGEMWHSVFTPDANAISALQRTPGGGLLLLCLVAAGDVFNAEVWHLPTLVLPMAQAADDWRMVLALDALRVPLARMSVMGEVVVLAAQNMVAVATLALGQARTATLPEGVAITALVAADGGLVAGTSRGVFSSNDEGATWQPCAGELGEVPVVALLTDGDTLCTITLGGDVWHGYRSEPHR